MKLRRPSPHVVVAIPTIAARGNAWERTAEAYARHTCQPVMVVPSWAPGGWCAGLNEVWSLVRARPPDLFVCGSDDMQPADDNWLPPLLEHAAHGVLPAPTVIDPRFTNYGGHSRPVADGTPSHMSTLPVLAGAWLGHVFPLPETLSYYADNLIAAKLARAGIKCVAVPSSRFDHLWLAEGRGFGLASEHDAMKAHSEVYTAELAALGIDRGALPAKLRGPLYRPGRRRG